MGLFQHKQEPQAQTPKEAAAIEAERLLDDELREELRHQGRLYFERVINENAALFKQDLDATIAHINTELKQHIARQLDDQFIEIAQANTQLKDHVAHQLDDRFAEYDQTIKDAQDLALQSLNQSAQALHDQHQQLGRTLEKSIADQQTKLSGVLQDTLSQVAAMKDAQDKAVQTLNQSVQALEAQRQQLDGMLEKAVAEQQAVLIAAFQDNMAQVIEHYLLEAVGDQFDMKSQVPSIIKQLDANKQTIMDDIAA